MESTLRAQKLDGTSHHIELPMFILIETRARVHPNKQAGEDGLLAEMLQLLDLPALDVIGLSFERRTNAVPGYCEVVPDWAKILAHCLPKTRSAHQMLLWRPISLISALGKWYLSCLARLLRRHSSPYTCHLLGFDRAGKPRSSPSSVVCCSQSAVNGVCPSSSGSLMLTKHSIRWSTAGWIPLSRGRIFPSPFALPLFVNSSKWL